MVDRLRTPFFVIAVLAMALVVLVELGSALVLGGGSAGAGLSDQAAELGVVVPNPAGVEEPPGRGIPYLVLMVSLLLATPFGTIAYLALFGFFPRGDAAILLSLLMFLKLVFAGALVLAHQRFLQNKGLVLLVLTSLVATMIVAFLHSVVPVILVSITDDIGAIVVAMIAIIWGVVLLIGSIPAVIKSIRVTVSG